MDVFTAVFGVGMGGVLYLVKLALLLKATKPFPRIRNFMHERWYGILLTDFMSMLLASELLSTGTNVGMVASTTFAIGTGVSIVTVSIINWFTKLKTKLVLKQEPVQPRRRRRYSYDTATAKRYA